jgi:hypothetical protein
LARASLRDTFLPMNFQSFASFNLTSVGTGIAAAAVASCPNVARLPAAVTTPSFTAIDCGETLHCFAAAATIMARAVAPALRSWSHEFAMAVEPPVPWSPRAKFL